MTLNPFLVSSICIFTIATPLFKDVDLMIGVTIQWIIWFVSPFDEYFPFPWEWSSSWGCVPSPHHQRPCLVWLLLIVILLYQGTLPRALLYSFHCTMYDEIWPQCASIVRIVAQKAGAVRLLHHQSKMRRNLYFYMLYHILLSTREMWSGHSKFVHTMHMSLGYPTLNMEVMRFCTRIRSFTMSKWNRVCLVVFCGRISCYNIPIFMLT